MEVLKKTILFTVTNDLVYDQRMIRICTSLSHAGYDVKLIGRKKKTSSPLPGHIFGQKRISCIFEKGKLFYIEYNLRLFFFLLFAHAEIYCAIDADTLPANTLVSKIKSRKLVYDSHEYFTEVPEVVNRKVTKKIWETVEKLCIPHTSLCYTVSQSLAEILSEKYGKPFSLIRNLPYTKAANASDATSASTALPVIIYQGDLNEGRGLEELIVAMKGTDAVLKIAGKGPLEVKLKQLVKESGLEKKVVFMGYLLPGQLASVTAEAYIGFSAIRNIGLSYYYSLSNKFFNYIQAGIPQVCCDFPEYRLINDRYEVAVLCDLDKDDLSTVMQRLLSDRVLYQKLKNNCAPAAKEFNWEQEEQKLIELYREL